MPNIPHIPCHVGAPSSFPDPDTVRARIAMSKFTLEIPDEIERQLRKCRGVIQKSIQKRLADILESVAASPKKTASSGGPPLRFYVYEGFRVSYQINPATRRVVVLNIKTETG
jgi:mRNA-degrading endonuclease RelE of RelBE toxin-antitoxin system